MIRFRLLLRYGLTVLAYALPLTALLMLGAMMAGAVPPIPGILPWFYLDLLATLGLAAGIMVRDHYNPHEYFLHANHGLSRRTLWPAAAGTVWLCVGAASLALRQADGRLQLQTQWQLARQSLAASTPWLMAWLKAYPQLPLLAAGLLLLAIVVWLLLQLSGGEEAPGSEDSPWELEIDSATHAFGARKVLKGAWLKCRGGEIIGLLGRNGCGKSTLLQILFGTQQADFRALFLNGKPLARPYLIPGLIAYLPQPSFLPRYLRVRQAIRLFGGRQGLEKLSREPRILEMLATRVSQLSGGEKRFLELGLILSLDRLFVLLDEPFSELEPLYKQRVREWIKEEAAAGKGIVVTDHDYRQILEVGQRVVLMTQGQTRPVANLKELDRIYLPLDT